MGFSKAAAPRAGFARDVKHPNTQHLALVHAAYESTIKVKSNLQADSTRTGRHFHLVSTSRYGECTWPEKADVPATLPLSAPTQRARSYT